MESITSDFLCGSRFSKTILLIWMLIGYRTCGLDISPVLATVLQNDTMILTCTASFMCNDLLFEWQMNSRNEMYVQYINSSCNALTTIPTGYSYTCGPQASNCVYTMSKSNVQIDQNGKKWKCIGYNEKSAETEVIVTVPISRVQMTTPTISPITVFENKGSTFVCETSPGKPAATIQWYKRLGTGSQVAITDNIVTKPTSSDLVAVTRSTLTFVPSRSDHDYQIYCTAYNIDAQTTYTSSNSRTLYVSYPCEAPLIQSTTSGSEYRIIDGKLQTLTCTAKGGRPLANLTWNCFNGNEQQSTSETTVSRSVTWTARKNQEGERCTCQPSYTISEWNRQAYVQIKVLYPPSLPIITINGQTVPGVLSVIENRTVNIHCSSDSVPAATYTWTHQGTPITNSVLTLSNVQIDDGGIQYTCTARNTMISAQGTEEGSNSTQFSLNVLYPPREPRLLFNAVNSQLIIPQQPLYVVKGDSFSILCNFTSSNPEPSSFQWTDQKENNNVLTVTGIQTDRSLTCTATNNMTPSGGNHETGTGSVTVSAIAWYGPSPPKMTYYLGSSSSVQLQSELHVVKGTSISVSCGGSDSKPVASYRWSSPIVSSSTERLTISNIEKRYNNIDFVCTAENVMNRTFGNTTHGKSHSSLKLIVLYGPTVHPLSNVTIVENQTFTNTCQKSEPGNPAETQYTWTLTNGSTHNHQMLSIQKVTRTDMGMYTCEAWNNMNPTGGSTTRGTDSSTFWLNVLYGSSISHFTINGKSDTLITFNHTSTLSISCLVDSNPGSTITIKRDNRVLSSVSDGVEANYTMTDVRCTDAGVYSCTAFNEYNGESRPTTQHNVMIRSPPVTVEPENNKTFYVAVHNSITISLTVCAYPRPSSVLWYKLDNNTDSTNITTGNKISIYPHYNLTIEDINMTDLGAYQIVLDNGLTPMLKHQFYIVAQGPPEVPPSINLESATLTHDSLLIKWRRGFNGGLDQTFYIQYRPISDTTWTTLKVTDTGEATMNITLTGLNPGTSYEVRVYAGNGQGNSSTTEPLQFTTNDKPSSTGNNIGVIAGAASGSVAALIIIVVIVFLQRRYHCIGGKQEKEDKTKMRTNMAYEHNEEEDEEDGDVLVENAAYVSAGPYIREDALQSTEYATVNKPKVVTGGDIYAQVNKKKPEAIYAMPDKKKGGKKDEKDAKEKKKGKGKDEKKKKGGKSKGTQDDTYENAEIGAVGQRQNDENLYELTDTSAKSSRKVNEDGLIYIDVVIDNNNKKKGGQHSNEIHGKDDMTEYTMIDFCKRADPLPDSDTEEK